MKAARPSTSPQWHRVAGLRPRLRGHARVHRHSYRGETWYVLQNPASRRLHRFNAAAYRLIGLLDGKRTLQEAWELAGEGAGEAAPSQDEAIRLLAQLHQADLLQAELSPDSAELLRRLVQQRRRRWLQYLISPLAMRFPLFDPERLLERGLAFYRPLFSGPGFLLWAAVVGAGVLLAGAHWRELTENLSDRVLAPQNLVIAALLFPLVKALHEFGHAGATRAWGGEVHEMGIMLLVLLPIPYVDASASSAFVDKRRRIVVGAAGMMVELFLAALAMFAWLLMEPGVLRAAMFNVMLIAGVSTLVFNGNPLLRYDGYYILGDLLEIPNLAQRAARQLLWLVQRWLLGLRGLEAPPAGAAERAWLIVFGIASFAYRLCVMLAIALFIGAQYFFFGALLAIWTLASAVAWPLARGVLFVLRSGRGDLRTRAAALAAGAVLVVALAPFPLWTRTEGVVRIAEGGQVRAGTDGFVRRLVARSGERVRAGQPIAELDDPLLSARIAGQEAKVDELGARYFLQAAENRALAERVKDELASAQAELSRYRERGRALVLRAEAEGELIVPRAEDLAGRFVKQGEVIGYVMHPSLVSARAIVPQESVELVRASTRAVELRMAHDRTSTIVSAIQREVPAASSRLPSASLGTAGGGLAASDPRDPRGTAAMQRHFEFDLALEGKPAGVGERVYVRFDHGYAPLAWQWYRALRQLFLARFNV